MLAADGAAGREQEKVRSKFLRSDVHASIMAAAAVGSSSRLLQAKSVSSVRISRRQTSAWNCPLRKSRTIGEYSKPASCSCARAGTVSARLPAIRRRVLELSMSSPCVAHLKTPHCFRKVVNSGHCVASPITNMTFVLCPDGWRATLSQRPTDARHRTADGTGCRRRTCGLGQGQAEGER